MPSNILTTDTSFPQLTDKQTTDEKFSVITNYLYMLLEQLRYTMANLGVENFNDAEFDHISELITDPVYVRLEDAEGNIASLTLTAENLTVRMEDAEGNLSVLQQTASSLTVRISDAEGNISVLQQTATSLTSRISDAEGNLSILQQTATSLTSRISDAEGNISSLIQTVDSITLSVSNGSTSSYISLSIDGVVVASQNIYMSGLVTYTGLAGGTTTIDGACIKTGTIDANRLNLSGAITFSDLSSDVRNDINTVSRWTYSGTTYIDGAQIMTGTVSASTLEGGSVNLLNYAGGTVGILTMTGASSSSYAIDLTSFGALRLTGRSGDVFLQSGDTTYLHIMGDLVVGFANLRSNQSGNYSCGTSIYRWSEVYSSTSEITTSDRNLKNTISYDLTAYDALFSALKPCSFQYNDGKSGRTHIGMIAQDVEEALSAAGLTSLDFAGFVRSPDEKAGGGYLYSLRYEEFIGLCIREIQRLSQRIDKLEEQL